MNKRVVILGILVVMILALGGYALGAIAADKIAAETGTSEIPNPIVTIKMKSGSIIKLELYPKIAPNTVANFVELAQSGFYDGLTFHRVIPHFMIQGGDPLGNGTGGPAWSIKGEFANNNFKHNNLKHTRGVISMARSGDPDSAGSQFFIMHADSSHLDGDYAAFGQVSSGMDVVDQIANTPVDANAKPLTMTDCIIDTVTVDTDGYEYQTVKIEQ